MDGRTRISIFRILLRFRLLTILILLTLRRILRYFGIGKITTTTRLRRINLSRSIFLRRILRFLAFFINCLGSIQDIIKCLGILYHLDDGKFVGIKLDVVEVTNLEVKVDAIRKTISAQIIILQLKEVVLLHFRISTVENLG